MRLLFKLGLRSIGRNKMRSVLTVAAVVLCTAGLFLFSVLFSGMLNMLLDGFLNQTGHARLLHKQLLAKPKLGRGVYYVDKADKLLANARKTKNVRAAVLRIELAGFLEHDKSQYIKDKEKRFKASKLDKNRKQAPAPGVGLDPVAEREVWDLHTKLAKGGRMMKPKGREIVLGYRLARRLQAKVGATLVVLGKTVDDSMSAIKVTVVGIVATGMPLHDRMFFVNIPTARYFLDIAGQSTAILVFGKALWQGDAIAASLRTMPGLPDTVSVQSWTKTPLAKIMVPLMKVFLYILGGIVVFIGGIGLLNTMMMTVLERREEVGVMMALGMTPRKISGVFLFEGMVFGLLGATIGVLVGLLASIPLVTGGLKIASEEQIAKVPMAMTTTVQGAITTEGIVAALLVGVFTTIFGTLWPAWKASKMPPLEALRKG